MGDLKEPFRLDLPTEDLQILTQHRTKLNKFGLDLKQDEDDGQFYVDKVPKCFLNRMASAKYFHRECPLDQLVHDLAREMAQTLRETRGGLNLLPTTVSDVLKSQACRSKLFLQISKFVKSRYSLV